MSYNIMKKGRKKLNLKEAYRREYWDKVRSGEIRRGVKFRTVVTSAPGQPLTFKVLYEDDPQYKLFP